MVKFNILITTFLALYWESLGRETRPVTRQNIGTLKLSSSDSMVHQDFSYFYVNYIVCPPSRTLLARLLGKLRLRRRRPYDLRIAPFHDVIGPLSPQHHHQALFAFQTHRTIGSGLPSLVTILRSYCRLCGDQRVLRHAMSPHGLVHPIKRSRIPGHLVMEGDSAYSKYGVYYLT